MNAKAGSTLLIHVVDASKEMLREATVEVKGTGILPAPMLDPDGRFVLEDVPAGPLTVRAQAPGHLSQTLSLQVRDPVHQIVLGLPKEGELSYQQGDSRLAFAPDRNGFLLFAQGPAVVGRLAEAVERAGLKFRLAFEKRPAEIGGDGEDWNFIVDTADAAAAIIEGLSEGAQRLIDGLAGTDIELRTTRLIRHDEHLPTGLGNDLVARFEPDVEFAQIRRLAAHCGLEIVRRLETAPNTYLLRQPGLADYKLLERADGLSAEIGVIYAEPSLTAIVTADAYTPSDPLWTALPHLSLIGCDAAWDRLDDVAVSLRGGSPTVTIAVIDGFSTAPDHPDLTATLTDGTCKLIANVNFTATPPVGETAASLSGEHGTQCAGAATAAFDNLRGMAGVAPNCRLLAARIGAFTDPVRMADIFLWAAGLPNGIPSGPPAPSQPADVISCSDGLNGVALSPTIRDCFDLLTTNGRGGRGCVLCFSVGNTGYRNFTNPTSIYYRAWASDHRTIGVGATINSNPTNVVVTSLFADPNGAISNIPVQVDRRALYSPFGSATLRKPDLVSPSHTAFSASRTKIDPAISCVNVGTGNVNGCTGGQVCNDYSLSFGGTSHSCPTVAGAAALVLSVRPNLSWSQVRDILQRAAVQVDPGNVNPIGRWQDLDGDGVAEFSCWYGHGRLNVDAAVQIALDMNLT